MISCRFLLLFLLDKTTAITNNTCNCEKARYDSQGSLLADHENTHTCLVDTNNQDLIRNDYTCVVNATNVLSGVEPTCCQKKIIHLPDGAGYEVRLKCIPYESVNDYLINKQECQNKLNIEQECCCSFCPANTTCSQPICPAGGFNNSIYVPLGDGSDRKSPTSIQLIPYICLVLALLAGVYIWKKKICCKRSDGPNNDEIELTETGALIHGGNTESTMVNQNPDGSSSGQGEAELVVYTISREIRLGALVGKGRYGIVYRGTWSGKDVAAKIFDSRDAESWKRETEIYSTTLINHANILHYIAQDNKDAGIALELWLITDYHERGSLFDYLKGNTVSIADALLLAHTACAGIEHLHKEINGTQGKPQIAHRDIKSKNILVKSDGECAVADFGLAVVFDSQKQLIDLPKGTSEKFLVGTKRYMPPELLSSNFRDEDFMSFRRADIYSLSLVLWEIVSRTQLSDEHIPGAYKLPYEDDVSAEPTLQAMELIVCQQKMRPAFPSTDEIPASSGLKSLERLCKVITECWTEEPTWRLSALKMKKDLSHEYNEVRPQPK